MSATAITRLASAFAMTCLLPFPSSAEVSATRGIVALPLEWVSEVRCAANGQDSQETPKMPRVIGWLYRWVRGFDVERSRIAAPQLYLRSPLLTGFNESVDCPITVVEPRTHTCVAVTASDGIEHRATYLVTLPHAGARTADDLEGFLRKRLGEGEPVLLRTLAGSWIRLDPAFAREIMVKACGSEIG